MSGEKTDHGATDGTVFSVELLSHMGDQNLHPPAFQVRTLLDLALTGVHHQPHMVDRLLTPLLPGLLPSSTIILLS